MHSHGLMWKITPGIGEGAGYWRTPFTSGTVNFRGQIGSLYSISTAKTSVTGIIFHSATLLLAIFIKNMYWYMCNNALWNGKIMENWNDIKIQRS